MIAAHKYGDLSKPLIPDPNFESDESDESDDLDNRFTVLFGAV
jgi:hypothetical protein